MPLQLYPILTNVWFPLKDEICAALEEYNIHIEELKTEMDEATRSADSIRLDIRELKSRYAF